MASMKKINFVSCFVSFAMLAIPVGMSAQQVWFDFGDEQLVVELAVPENVSTGRAAFVTDGVPFNANLPGVGLAFATEELYSSNVDEIIQRQLNTRRHRPHAMTLMIVGVGGMVAAPFIGGTPGALVGLGGVVVGVYGALLYFDAI